MGLASAENKERHLMNVNKTSRLFDEDSKAYKFTAIVMSCEERDGKYTVVLDGTLFFPEEGGQTSDTGTLGGSSVSYVYEKQGVIYHECDKPLVVGDEVEGEIAYGERFRKMQNHTGEHIISGIVHKLYGYDNVGFHLGSDDMTIDFNGPLTREQLDEIELLANGMIVRCLPVKAYYPDPSQLEALNYRSKLDLTENVRIVQIGDVDICACCAPHVENTGEVGIIKILDFMRYKGGVRIHALCGLDALEDYGKRYSQIYSISTKISAKQNEVAEGVDRLLAEINTQKAKISDLKRELQEYKIAELTQTEGNMCIFEDDGDMTSIRHFANEAVKKCGGMCAVFCGNDNDGYRYIIMSRKIDLKTLAKDINTALDGRGGGSSEMITGSCKAKREDIEKYFG